MLFYSILQILLNMFDSLKKKKKKKAKESFTLNIII